MPYLRVSEGLDAVDIYYHIFDDEHWHGKESRREQSGSVHPGGTYSRSASQQNRHTSASTDKPLVVLIMGFAAGQAAWTPQLHGLLHPAISEGGTSLRVLTMDNRGVGKSSSPRSKGAYSTSVMAQDVLALMDHLGWQSAHVVGHSMGGMIAMKLAVQAPERVCSLSVISATGGGWQSLPFSWRATKSMWKAYRAGSGRERAAVDIKFHFMRETLRQYVLGRRRKEMLLEEYTGYPDAAVDTPPDQPKWALKGQLSAIWNHSISSKEFDQLNHAIFRRQVIHGRYDILAAPKYAAALAKRMCCRLVELEGAHFVTRECGTEVNSLLHAIIFPAQSSLEPQHYMTSHAGSEIVSGLRAPSTELDAAVELVQTGRMVANVLGNVAEDTAAPSGESLTASGITSNGSSTGSNLHLLAQNPGSRRSKTS